MLDGEPTSVAIIGGKALTAVNTEKDKQHPTGKLEIIDIKSKTVEASCDLGGQPDSIAISPDKSFAAIAIENERDEELNDGALPQMPAGDLVIVPIKDGAVDCSGLKHVAMTGLSEIAPEDPEPEFVSINSKGEIALTLQENNHIVIVDGKSGKVTSHFSAGKVDISGTDVKTNGALEVHRQAGRRRARAGCHQVAG
jgi:DNA-binding beta-propeller fold protein YncE